MEIQPPVITIDGPSGSGKGTVAERLASHLGWHYLDSGVLYRVLGLAAQKHGIALDNEAALTVLAAHLDVQFKTSGISEAAKILFEGQDLTGEIRNEKVGALASQVSAFLGVREALLQRQRDFCQLPGLVTDGRDMGTVVFPEAILKFFLLANCHERAERRYKQLKQAGISVNLAALEEELALRDARDSQRRVAPMVPAENAVLIDTSGLSIDDVMARVLIEVERCLPTE